MEIIFNDEMKEIEESISLETLLSNFGYSSKKFAVAINYIFVPKHHYKNTILKQDDVVDIIMPMQGG